MKEKVVIGRASVEGSEAPKTAQEPLIVLDGKVLGKGKSVVENIPPATIASMNVLKGEKATEKYGVEGADGVVEVFSKDYEAKKGAQKTPKEATKIVIRGENKEQPLFIVDGVPLDRSKGKNATKDIDPNDIESISVLKGKSAIETYGEEGKTGVVIITTKKQAKKMAKVLADKDRKSDRAMDRRMVYVNGEKRGLWKDVKSPIDKNDIATISVVGKSRSQRTLQRQQA